RIDEWRIHLDVVQAMAGVAIGFYLVQPRCLLEVNRLLLGARRDNYLPKILDGGALRPMHLGSFRLSRSRRLRGFRRGTRRRRGYPVCNGDYSNESDEQQEDTRRHGKLPGLGNRPMLRGNVD